LGGGREVGRLEEYLGVPRKKIGFKDDGTKKKAREKKGTGKKAQEKNEIEEKKTTDQEN
jgi:hypothetical protein